MRVVGIIALALLLPGAALAALININTADAELLDTLPGIGPAKAAAIVDYRMKHGPFMRIEDIQNVSGIGSSTFANIQSLITVGDTATKPSSATSTSENAPINSGASTYVPPPSAISLTIIGPHEAMLNAPFRLSAQVLAKSVVDAAAQIAWSFGDGSSQTGIAVEKIYRHAGTFVVTAHAIDGSAKASDEIVVTVRTARIRLSTSGEGITVMNDSDTRLDLSDWRLLADVGIFRIPEGTMVLPQASVLFPYEIINLPIAQDASLAYPDGVIAARSRATPPVQPSSAADRSPLIRMTNLDEEPAGRVDPINRSTTSNIQAYAQAQAIVAPAAAIGLAAAGAPLIPATSSTPLPFRGGLFSSPWIAGLIGVIALAGGAFIFI
ncbi:helix-hairpin-helix domain-containing protein [Patescibacteria group bacterium]|nr:helix-hairpin-helix domain-containing protein [Patescibacteria group bacterium]